MEEEVLMRRHDVRRDVEQLTGPHAGVDAAGDVAHTVGASAARRDADGVQALVHVDDDRQIDPVHLHVLARGDVQDAARVVVGDVRQHVGLRRRSSARPAA